MNASAPGGGVRLSSKHMIDLVLVVSFGLATAGFAAALALMGAWAVLPGISAAILLALLILRRDPARAPSEATENRPSGPASAEHSNDVAATRPETDPEEALRDIRELMDSVPVLLGVVDTEHRYEFVNRAYERLHGRPRAELEGFHLRETLGDDVYAAIRPHVERVLRGETVRFESEFPNPQGDHPFCYETAYLPRRARSGVVTGFYSHATNISRRKQEELERQALEKRMQQAQKLESLGVLAGGIAHEFNNLLVSMLANADLARRDRADGLPVEEALEQIEGAARRAADLSRQMLEYSGKGHATVGSIDLSRTTREMAHLLEVSLAAGVELRFDLDESLPPIDADVAQIRQVIMNLITNASESMEELGGAIEIRTGVWSLTREDLAATYIDDELPGGVYVFLEVSDSGCGMDEETLKNLFDPFFTTKFTGRGLGLAAVLGIARTHQGAIEVVSKPGAGTTIRLFVPAARTDESGADVVLDDVPARWRGEGCVLVVDDEVGIRRVAKRILESVDLQVDCAESGAEAIELYKRNPNRYDAIVLDLTMPDMDGEMTLLALRSLGADAPVVLCSGYSEVQVKERFEDLEFFDVIEKPFDVDIFIRVVRAALNAQVEGSG